MTADNTSKLYRRKDLSFFTDYKQVLPKKLCLIYIYIIVYFPLTIHNLTMPMNKLNVRGDAPAHSSKTIFIDS